MSIFKQTQLKDMLTNRLAYISFLNALKVESTTRLSGPNFTGSTFDTNFWTETNANGGTNTVANMMCLMQTNTTANGSSSFISVRTGRFMFACPNIYRRAGRFLDTGTTNNKRKFGVYDSVSGDGFFFQLNGTTFSIGYQRGGAAESLVNSGSFNGDGTGSGGTFTVDTNVHAYEIHYFVMKVEFYIDGVLKHTLTPTTTTLTAKLTLPIYEANINSGGSTTNVQMEVWNVSILRIGKEDHSTITKNISGAATTVLKYGAGHIDSLVIGSTVAGTITIYDNTAASGTILATITTINNVSIGAILQNCKFYTGLTVVTSVAGHNVTVIYE